MRREITGMLMVGVGIYTSELEAMDFDAMPDIVNTRVTFRHRTMPAFSVAIYSGVPIPHRRAMH